MKIDQTFNQVLALLYAVLWGEATAREKQCAENLKKNPDIRRIYDELRDIVYLEQRIRLYDRFDSRQRFGEFRKKVYTQRSGSHIFYRMLRYASVMILLLTGGGFMWWFLDFPGKKAEWSGSISGVPGKSVAILKLTGGNVLDLSERLLHIDSSCMFITSTDDSIVFFNHQQQEDWAELSIPRGGEYHFRMEDGTEVWLNSDSELKFPVLFSGFVREVYAEGEVFFKVKKHPDQPFLVHTRCGDIRVYGTSFGVRTYEDAAFTRITLAEGSIGFISFVSGKQVRLKPGEQIVTDLSGKLCVTQVDVKEWLAWKDGLFVFKDRSLADIVKELSRWYNIPIEFQEQELGRMEFSGILSRYARIDTFMEILAATQDIRYQKKEGKIIIYK